MKTRKELRRLVFVNAYHAYVNMLVSPKPPALRMRYEQMSNPQIGDLVMEISTIYMPDRDEDRMGRLLRIEEWPFETEEEWAALIERGEVSRDDRRPSRAVWVLGRSDGSTYTWDNARFIKVWEEMPTT